MHDVSHTAVSKWQKSGWLVLQGSKVDVEGSNAKLAKYRDSGDARATRGRSEVSTSEKSETKSETVIATKVSKKVSAKVSKSAGATPAKSAHSTQVVAPGSFDDAPLLLPGESAEDAAARLTSGLTLDPDGTTIEEARRVKEVYLALLNRLTYEEKSGALINLELARTVLFECARAARDSWLNWPARVAPLIAADLGIEADKMTEILTEHVHTQIASLGEPEGDFTAS
ncbi:TPA: hypothetical protein ACU967_002248 [Burkholderia contaminans]|uniref:hypothetical protein n=1 Tax=Burkholderia contaminans TaxID=488447 RepID=UPI001CF5265D|nr:hypothetical protein [Burkholderia contaminans]MCA7876761.1 hypothetical protein [Burkholderia contaminans]MDN8024216.1 hypothetical protein [Burkholderia contaminans]